VLAGIVIDISVSARAARDSKLVHAASSGAGEVMNSIVSGVAVAVSLLIGGSAVAAEPDAQNSGSRRLEFFSRTQVTCKLVVLGDAKKGAAFVALLANSDKKFEEVCECAAVYAVSQTSDDSVKRLMAGEMGEIFDKYWEDLHKALPICIPSRRE
jgi:hypothetical protein